jgi:ABC-type sugar transport system substrate-binding protein
MSLRSRTTRTSLVALSAVAVMSSAACSNSTGTSSDAGSTATAAAAGASSSDSAAQSSQSAQAISGKAIKSLLFVNPLPNYPAWKTIGDCMKKEAEKNGIAFTQAGPNGNNVDTKLMLDRMQQGIANKVDAIVTFPVSAEQFDPILQQAKSAGIYTATVEGGQTKNQTLNAGTSFTQYGELAAKTVAAKGGQQNVAFLTQGPTGPDAEFVGAFKAAAAAKYPNIKIVDSRYDGGDTTKALDLATAMMTAHPDLNHFVTNEGADTPPVIAAIKAKNKVGKVFLTTSTIYSGSVEGMQAGIVYSFLLQNMCAIGSTPVDALLKVSKGQSVPPNIPTPIEFATKDTVKQLTASGDLQ